MRRGLRVVRSVVAVAAMTLVGGLLVAAPAQAAPGNVVISQVYGGGGNSGATYTHDFVELFNRSAAPADVSNWVVQYASATGTFSTTQNIVTIPAGTTLAPGQYLLCREHRAPAGLRRCPHRLSPLARRR